MDEGFRHSAQDATDRYVDGLLPAPDAAEFERRMAEDASLREEVESLRAVDDSLRAYFGDWRRASPPVQIKLDEASATGGAVSRLGGRLRRRQSLLAASIVLVLMMAGAFVLLRPSGPGAEQLYQQQLASGFTPMWVCDTDQEFARWTNNILRQPLVPASVAPTGVRTLGWSRAGDDNPLSPSAALMLADLNGTEIVVLVDRLENDADVRVSKDSGLHVFRKELGPLVLYELTPLDRPAAVNSVELAPADFFERGV